MKKLLLLLVIPLLLTGFLPTTETHAQEPLLPAPLYYLFEGQIYMMDRQGATSLLNTPVNVRAFDVNPVDNALAYVIDNNLFVADHSGENPMLVFAGDLLTDDDFADPLTYINRYLNAPVWSPNGEQLAFGYGGVNIIPREGGEATLVRPNEPPDPAMAMPEYPIGARRFEPESWSPAADRLLVYGTYYPEALGYEVVDLSDNSTLPILNHEGYDVCCDLSWSVDGTQIFIASDTLAYFEPGLWVNNLDGANSQLLIAAYPDDESVNLIGPARQLNDGLLYFFAATGNYENMEFNAVLRRSEPTQASLESEVVNDTPLKDSVYVWADDETGLVFGDSDTYEYNQETESGSYELFWYPLTGEPMPLAVRGTSPIFGANVR